MILLTIILYVFSGLLCYFIYDNKYKKIAITLFIIFLFFIPSSIYINLYENCYIGMEELITTQNNILINYKTLATNLNKVAITKQNNNILIDTINLNQSTITSEVYKEWVHSVNEYNLALSRSIGIRKISWVSKLWRG